MRIETSNVQLSAAHLFEATQTVSERLKVQTRPVSSDHRHNHRHGDRFEAASRSELDPVARLTQALAKFRSGQSQTGTDGERNGTEPLADRIAAIVQRLDDRLRKADAPAKPEARLRVQLSYRRKESYQETEALSFKATGSVSTADGRQIDISQSLEIARSYARTETISLRLHGLIGSSFDPSVQAGSSEAPAVPAADSEGPTQQGLSLGGRLLGFDANGDGAIDPATELVGGSGNGFAELAQYDEDGNGFIDEGDSIFGKLALVDRDGDGVEAATLASRGVGAIYTGSVATPYTVTDAGNRPVAQLARSGIYLNENGTTGVVQQVNLLA